MNTAGLSLSDAPPYKTVYPFFIASAFFGIFSFAALLFADEPNRYDPFIIASIHLFTIGFLLNAIFGSLVQMLPVVGGVTINSPKIIKFSLFGLSIGTALFFFGFVFYKPLLFGATVILFSVAILFFGMLFFSIFKNRNAVSPTAKRMSVALIAAVIALGLGAHLLYSHASAHIGASHMALANTHIMFSVFGFVGVLIISVAHQVLPMFYVTPEFPKFCRVWPFVIFIACLALFIPIELINILAKLTIWTAFLAFGVVALKKLKQRRRLMSDASLKLWQTGLVSLIISLLLWAYDAFFELPNKEFLFAVFFGLGFIGSTVKAMMNKIVPFLAWFHLTSMGKWDAPSVREMITDKMANVELWLHWSAIVIFALSYMFSSMFWVGCALACLSFFVLFYNITGVVKIFKEQSL
jgi:hypothetical protein